MHSAFADGGEHRIIGCDGKEYRGDEPWKTIERDLAKSPVVADWPKGYDGLIKNPVDFYLVSYHPNIVIACAPASRAIIFPSGDSKVFQRSLVVGTVLSCPNPESWITVPGGASRALTKVSDMERRIEYQSTIIILKREGQKWLAVRESE